MPTIVQSKLPVSTPSVRAFTLGAMIVLGIAGVVLVGSVAPGKAGQQRASVSRVPPPDVRDHRPKPPTTDHRTKAHDHRVERPVGSVHVTDTKRGRHAITRRNKVPCYGNLC
jgi:hypothetical protein